MSSAPRMPLWRSPSSRSAPAAISLLSKASWTPHDSVDRTFRSGKIDTGQRAGSRNRQSHRSGQRRNRQGPPHLHIRGRHRPARRGWIIDTPVCVPSESAMFVPRPSSGHSLISRTSSLTVRAAAGTTPPLRNALLTKPFAAADSAQKDCSPSVGWSGPSPDG